MGEGPDPVVASGPTSRPYRDDGVAVHWLRYHLVLVTRRSRPFFSDAVLAARAEELVRQAAEGIGGRVRACEVRPSVVLLEVEAPAGLSVATWVARGGAGR